MSPNKPLDVSDINVNPTHQPDDEIKYQQDAQSIVSDQKSFSTGDVLSQENADPVLKAKLHLVNDVRYPDELFGDSLLT
jgi:hypothetical protein